MILLTVLLNNTDNNTISLDIDITVAYVQISHNHTTIVSDSKVILNDYMTEYISHFVRTMDINMSFSMYESNIKPQLKTAIHLSEHIITGITHIVKFLKIFLD